MISGRTSRRFAQFALLAIMAGELSAAAADVLVLRSAGPSQRRHPPGQRLPDNASFSLRPGDMVVVLAGGGTRTFRGPGTFSATGPARAGTAQVGPRRNTGAVRGPGQDVAPPAARPTDVWQWDVTRSGRACIATGTRPTLWRPSAETEVRLTITAPTGAGRNVEWPSGQATLAWPSAIPLTEGASYQLSWTGQNTPRRITVRTIPAPANDEALAAALNANDCQNQMDVFIAQHEVRATPSAPSGGTSQ